MSQDHQITLLQSETNLLKAQRSHLLLALAHISDALSDHPEVYIAHTKVRFCYQRAINTVQEVVEG